MELVPVNGSEPAGPADLNAISAKINDRLTQQSADLRDVLEAEQQVIDFLEGQLATHHERVKRVQRALAALEGTSTPGRKPAQSATPKKGAAWTISDKKVEEVYAVLVEAIEASDDGTTTMTEARERVGSSASETYRKAVDRLREQERIRVAGKTRGGGVRLALMPEAADAA